MLNTAETEQLWLLLMGWLNLCYFTMYDRKVIFGRTQILIFLIISNDEHG